MAKKTAVLESKEADAPKVPIVIDDAAVSLKLQAARVVASEKMPYLSVALYAMRAIRVDSLIVGGKPTLATDDKWRLYYHPLAVLDWPVEELAGVLLHEVGHCLRSHPTRFANLNENRRFHVMWNIAGDALINSDLQEDKVILPGKPYYIENMKERHKIDVTRDMTTEKIYYLLREELEKSCTCGKDKSDKGEGQGQSDKGEGQGKDKSDKGEGQGKDKSDKGEGEGQGKDKSDKGEGQGQGQGGADSNCPLHGSHEHGDSGEPCEQCSEMVDCGSVADGVHRDYEAEGDKVDKGVDEARGDLIRQHVAVEIKNHVKNRGTVPAGLERWAKEFTEPVIDWRKQLAFIIRKTFAQLSGRRDYTYGKPSRRQPAMRERGSGILLPAMYQPAPPKISIVIDTSGSMSDEMLGWALAETKGVLRSLGASARGMKIISCDAQATSQNVTRSSQITLQGGGGTDMCVGITAAMKKGREKPDAIIVITDGFTPWPSEPLKGTILIVALTATDAAKDVPTWARTVIVTRDEKIIRGK